MLESASEAARESLSADHEFLGSWCWTSQSAWSTNDKNTEFNFSHLSITLVTTSYCHQKHHLWMQPLFCLHSPLSVCLAIKVSLPIMPQLLLDLLGLAPIHSMLVNFCGSFSITHSVPSKSHNLSSILCRQPEDDAYVAWLSPNIKATNSILSSLLPNNICTYK